MSAVIHSWFNVTAWALRDWNEALRRYYAMEYAWRRELHGPTVPNRWIYVARKNYRDSVLSWYRKLLLPMKPGDAVPNEVALLLAEEWDEATKWRPQTSGSSEPVPR